MSYCVDKAASHPCSSCCLGLLANELMIWELASQSGYKMLLYLEVGLSEDGAGIALGPVEVLLRDLRVGLRTDGRLDNLSALLHQRHHDLKEVGDILLADIPLCI